eukprot:6738731-Prymnesium_polylepis.1
MRSSADMRRHIGDAAISKSARIAQPPAGARLGPLARSLSVAVGSQFVGRWPDVRLHHAIPSEYTQPSMMPSPDEMLRRERGAMSK